MINFSVETEPLANPPRISDLMRTLIRVKDQFGDVQVVILETVTGTPLHLVTMGVALRKDKEHTFFLSPRMEGTCPGCDQCKGDVTH